MKKMVQQTGALFLGTGPPNCSTRGVVFLFVANFSRTLTEHQDLAEICMFSLINLLLPLLRVVVAVVVINLYKVSMNEYM